MWPYIILFPIAILLINFFSRPTHAVGFAVDCILFGLVIFFITTEVEQGYKKVFMLNCAAAIFVNLYLNTVFYNQIIVDKGEITAAEYVNQKRFDNYHLYSLRTANNIFQFYCKRPVDFIPLDQFNTFKPADSSAFYVNQESMDYLLKANTNFKLIKTFTEYPQENILPDFIDRNTRYKVLGLVYLITK